MSNENTPATIDEKTTAVQGHPPSEGRYGWNVETLEPEPADGIFEGDYISVNSQGALFIWGPDQQVQRTFEPGRGNSFSLASISRRSSMMWCTR